ncbi:hypothetical protein [uncultured Shimia sp.]|uniref:hypothetical protein n=1 Tax=uncultured Shimia sp. TaxID=573152 RepID=UPI0025DED517|nr:hypothetical protein [uncultured Shimia sp.]
MSKDIGQNENTPDLFGHVAPLDEPYCLGKAKPPGSLWMTTFRLNSLKWVLR